MRQTQCERVIDYINEFGSISGLEAFLDLGIMHLPARIYDLDKQGYKIDRKYESVKNRYGDNVSYVRYSFKNEKEAQ